MWTRGPSSRVRPCPGPRPLDGATRSATAGAVYNELAWTQNIIWGSNIVWGNNIIWGNNIVWDDNIIWGNNIMGQQPDWGLEWNVGFVGNGGGRPVADDVGNARPVQGRPADSDLAVGVCLAMTSSTRVNAVGCFSDASSSRKALCSAVIVLGAVLMATAVSSLQLPRRGLFAAFLVLSVILSALKVDMPLGTAAPASHSRTRRLHRAAPPRPRADDADYVDRPGGRSARSGW